MRVRSLDISHNVYIDTSYLDFQANLRRLVMTDMGNILLDTHTFANATGLQVLIMSNCSVRSLPAGFLDQCTKLRVIHLNNNYISDLDGVFTRQLLLKSIRISNNLLKRISDQTFVENKYLESLYLQGNLIDSISESAFSNNLYLIELDLRNNRIAILQTDCFSNNVELKYLNLSFNSMIELPEEIFTKLIRNKQRKSRFARFSIDLSHNSLKRIPTNLLSMQNEIWVDLSCNSLPYLPGRFFKQNSGFNQSVRLEGNPWKCPCLKDMLRAADVYKVNILDRLEGKSPACLFEYQRSMECTDPAGDAELCTAEAQLVNFCTWSPLSVLDSIAWKTRLSLYPDICNRIDSS